MHLHSMTIQALGPFVGRHEIDFAALGAGGLFLLEGPTGAGKSTVIDAVVFALYGKVASEGASEERLRSAHATPADETVVDLVFETGAGVFRVRRTPAYARPKQRGTGTTTQQASVKLWRLPSPDRPDDGELRSNRLDEVGLEIQRLVGLDRSQFVQTVVLPQGEFAAFLRAKPEDRRGLLQKVFGTEVYERLQQRLERMRADVGRGLGQAQDAVVRAADHFVGAAALDEEAAAAVRAAAEGGEESALVDLVTTTTHRLAGEATTTGAEAATARAAATAAREALDAGRALLAADRRRAALRSELATLEAGADEHEADVRRLERARRAAPVLPTLRGARDAVSAVEAAERALVSTRDAVVVGVRALLVDDDEPEVQRKALVAEQTACTRRLGTLERAVRTEDGLPDLRTRVATAERAVTVRTESLGTLEQECAAVPTRRTELAAAVAEVAGATTSLTSARERLVTVDRRLVAAREALDLETRVTAAESEVETASARAIEAVDRAAAVQRARLAGMAGELASRLAPGEPCAVCGGTEHPAPAALAPDHVTAEDVDAAEAARTTAAQALTEATALLGGLRERLEARRREAGGDLAALETERSAAADAVTAAEAAVRRHTALAEEQAELERHATELDTRLTETRTALEREKAALGSLRQDLVLAETEVADARGEASSVRERVEELTVRLEDVTALAEALAVLHDSRSRADARADELATCLDEHGFDEVTEAVEAALPGPELDALDRAVATYRSELRRVRAGLEEPEVRDLPDVVDVDLAALEQAHTVADAAAGTASGVAARAQHLAAAAASARDRLTAAVETLCAARAEAGPVVRMADLASASGGANGRDLTLATYVLLRRFEDVVAAANARLTTMSDGRYELVRSDTKEAVRARKAGLAMKVVDHRTGTERDPRTLSGGETFYVSLCLALGLADVVTAEAGGTDLGTLFVDEGFGTLDSETLEVVLAELGRLREGGRVVGVVSHVDALKQAIAERIEVRPRADGTSTLAVRA